MMVPDVHFYPERGENAFPDGCPCCGEPLRQYEPADDDNFAWWEFVCRSAFILEENGLSCEEECPDAMNFFMERIVQHLPDKPAPAPEPSGPRSPA